MSKRTVKSALSRDAAILSSNVEEYCKMNAYQYEVAINCHLLMAKHFNLSSALDLMYTNHGIQGTQRIFSTIGDLLIAYYHSGDYPTEVVIDGIDRGALLDRMIASDFNDALQFCWFLKRFQPYQADKLEAETLKHFLDNLNTVKLSNRMDLTGDSYVAQILAGAKEKLEAWKTDQFPLPVITGFTPGKNPWGEKLQSAKIAAFKDLLVLGPQFPLNKRMSPHENEELLLYKWADFYGKHNEKTPYWVFSAKTRVEWNGSLVAMGPRVAAYSDTVFATNDDVANVLLNVVKTLQSKYPGRDIVIRRVIDQKERIHDRRWWDVLDITKTIPVSVESFAELARMYTGSVEVVPKSLKTGRTIVREDTTRQWYLKLVRERSYLAMRSWAHEQQCNEKQVILPVEPKSDAPSQLAAFFGAEHDGSIANYATIDWSDASDLISVVLAHAVLPKSEYDVRYSLRSRFLSIPGKGLRVNHFWATMGAGNTWADMSMILWAILESLGDSYSRLTGEDRCSLLPTIMWGDDTAIDSRIAEMALDFLTRVGMRANREKSFWNGRFRESCGLLYLAGYGEVSVAYWPRKAIGRDLVESYEVLVDLEHRLYAWEDVRSYLLDSIRSLCSKKGLAPSFSLPYESDDEPWSDLPEFKMVGVPDLYDLDRVKDSREREVILSLKRESHLRARATALSLPQDLHTNPKYSNYLMLKYWEYLYFGPELSDDPTLRSLGITQSRLHPGDFSSPKQRLLEVRE